MVIPEVQELSRSGPPSELAEHCLDWLTEQLDWFRPATWEAHFPPREIPGQTVLELLLLTRMLARSPRAEERRNLIEGAREIAVANCVEPTFVARLARVDAQFPYLAWLVGLVGDDPRTAAARARVQHILDVYGPAVVGVDLPPTPLVELHHILSVGGFVAAVPGFDELFGPDAYASADPVRLEEPDVYAITHVLLYASDLGARPLTLTAAARTRLRDLLSTLLGVQLVGGQLDLSAELLHCLAALGEPAAGGGSNLLAGIGWQRLAAAQLPSGALPGPPYSEVIAAQRTPEELDAYVFRACYHTTIVAAMAALAAELAR